MSVYFVKYKGWKRPVEVIRHSRASALEKVRYLERHGIKCEWGHYDGDKRRVKEEAT